MRSQRKRLDTSDPNNDNPAPAKRRKTINTAPVGTRPLSFGRYLFERRRRCEFPPEPGQSLVSGKLCAPNRVETSAKLAGRRLGSCCVNACTASASGGGVSGANSRISGTARD